MNFIIIVDGRNLFRTNNLDEVSGKISGKIAKNQIMMRHMISEKITSCLLKQQIIKEEDAELYQYGFHDLVILFFTMVPIIVIAGFFGMLWQAILYLKPPIPLP